MYLVQRAYRKTDGRQFIPFVVSITPDKPEILNKDYLRIGDDIARIHPDFQCCYALHLDSKIRHLHFLMNAVSFRDGHKLSQSRADLSRFRQKINDVLYHFGLDPICEKLQLQPDHTQSVLKSDFGFWETEAIPEAPKQHIFDKPMGPDPHDFFRPDPAEMQFREYRSPDYPCQKSGRDLFEEGGYCSMGIQPVLFDPTFSAVPASECLPDTGEILPTVSFNLNSAFSGAPEQLAQAQSQIEQEQLNRAGTFALEFQRLAQAKGVTVNMQFNIHNDYDLTGGSGVIPVLPEDNTEDE